MLKDEFILREMKLVPARILHPEKQFQGCQALTVPKRYKSNESCKNKTSHRMLRSIFVSFSSSTVWSTFHLRVLVFYQMSAISLSCRPTPEVSLSF
jgi:hypothetical protein